MANVKNEFCLLQIFPAYGKILVEFYANLSKVCVRSGPAICSTDLSYVFNIFVCSQPTVFVTFEQLDAVMLHPNLSLNSGNIFFFQNIKIMPT